MNQEQPLRVLIVDDSRIFREAVQNALNDRPDIRVVGSVWSGEKAVDFIRSTPPDLVTLDINMPGQGGLETLSKIQELNTARGNPRVGVILVSALTSRGAGVTVEGLQRGAFDFICKPDGPDLESNQALLRRYLLEKIDLFAERRLRHHGSGAPPLEVKRPPVGTRSGRYQVVAIGSSTGGPEALARLLPSLKKNLGIPVLVVQHLPQGMTNYFAASLAKKCEYDVREASDGEPVVGGTVYIAPGGRHMVVHKQKNEVFIALNDLPPENGCRPAVDVLFRSVAITYPQAAIAVVLTGMGTDGARGLGPLKRNGAHVIAQDEATSVVWGMPRAAVETNKVDEILPIERIGPAVATLLGSRIKPCN